MHKAYHREQWGGGSFVTELPDGTEVPWKPLSIGQFLEYDSLIRNNVYPYVYIENEIFSKCVLDECLVRDMSSSNAGIVSTVVAGILLWSGPQSIDELQQYLEHSRIEAEEILHMLVTYICQAFQAYRPEDVYAMDYSTFMLRVAQAENKLLRTNAVSQPLNFTSNEIKPKEEPKQKPKKNTQDLLEKYYEQKCVALVRDPNLPRPKKKSDKDQTIIKQHDIDEHVMAYTGHEKDDKDVLEHQMVQQTSAVYQDYLQQSKDGKIIIKTPEQRKAEYLANAELLKRKYIKQKKDKELKDKILKEQETQEEKKPKKVHGKRRK